MEITGKKTLADLDRSFFETKASAYQDIQFHSAQIDTAFGLPVKETEKALRDRARKLRPEGDVESWSKELHDGVCTWVGLNPAQLQTPYAELLEYLDALNLTPNSRVIDLGAGYGRIGILMGALFPQCAFLGLEMAPERVELGNKLYKSLGIKNAIINEQNLASEDFDLPDACAYFIYEFGFLSDMKKLISKLERKADEKLSFSVIARGRGINSLIQETAPWLTVHSEPLINGHIYHFKA